MSKHTTTSKTDGGLNGEASRPHFKERFRTFIVAASSMTLLWLAFPPVGLSWLGWLALCPLIWLIESKTLIGRRPYRQLFLAGFFFWLSAFYFIPIPHPALWLGWLTVSAYMAIYTPLSVGIARSLIHRFRIPPVLAIPLVWTGIEWFRCNFATGMAMVCLSHTQYRTPILIQVADIFGAYTLTFVISLVSVGITAALKLCIAKSQQQTNQSSIFPENLKRQSRWAIAIAILTLIATLVYGRVKLGEDITFKNNSELAIALIQTNDDVVFQPITAEEFVDGRQRKIDLTQAAIKKWPDLDLIVWPESAFSEYTDLLSDFSPEMTRQAAAKLRTEFWRKATSSSYLSENSVPLLTGGSTLDPKQNTHFASAFLINNNGLVDSRYYKNHLVMFGEYVPLSDWFPIIKKISPIGGGINAGTEPGSIRINEINLSPNICFESTVPHFIRNQVNTLAKQNKEPDVLINMTNDGWFFGTSCLDLHLACNVFRAVEMRKTHLVCANTGLSAEIDSCGRLLQTGGRRQPGAIRTLVRPIEQMSLYRTIGDVIPMIMLIIATALFLLDSCRKKA
ncbi:apolipoprotein N-acyltransferase [Mariniblastus sp.]|nr:apolipoprotein N-acyltransferase [Mariniblastus sp.]